MVYKLKHIGTGIAGRPKGQENSVTRICWKSFCCDLRSMPEFEVPDDNSIIYYKVSKQEKIGITQIGEDEYQTFYMNGYSNINIKCQKLKNGTQLDKFVNRLLMDNWDWTLEGKIKQFCVTQSSELDKELED